MKASDQKHIDKVGLDVFNRTVGQAMVRLSRDARLLAAEKLRRDLAFEMALLATGAERRPFALATKSNEARYGTPTQEMQDIVDYHLNMTEAATHA
jgi:hypothetical protein